MDSQQKTLQPKILIVDDKEENIYALKSVLDSVDAQLVSANSGQQALKYALEDSLALILLDVQMPGMDGYEVAEFLRMNPRTRYIPIIFITALNRDETQVLRGYKEAGAIDYIYKPVNSQILLSKVNAILNIYGDQKRKNDYLSEELAKLRVKLEKQTAELDRLNKKNNDS